MIGQSLRGLLADLFERKARYREALETRKQQVARNSEAWEAYTRGYAEGGYPEAMRLRAELAVRRSQKQYVSALAIAGFYAAAGNRERALDWLENAYVERPVSMVRIKCTPRWDTLRDHPRFRALMRRMQLPE